MACPHCNALADNFRFILCPHWAEDESVALLLFWVLDFPREGYQRRITMKRRLLSTLSAGIALVVVLLAMPIAHAGDNSDTISIHFAANEPTQKGGSKLAPTDEAGVVPSANWNNTTTRAGYVPGIVRDTNGVATTTSATVLFEASTTFASTGKGEENNNFDP